MFFNHPMQLRAEFSLEDLTPQEMAQFELRCREAGVSPEAKLTSLIRSAITPDEGGALIPLKEETK